MSDTTGFFLSLLGLAAVGGFMIDWAWTPGNMMGTYFRTWDEYRTAYLNFQKCWKWSVIVTGILTLISLLGGG